MEYNKLVRGFRIKLFRFCLNIDNFYYQFIKNNLSYITFDKGLNFDDILKFYTDLYGKDIFNKYNELRDSGKYDGWLMPWLIDWYGIEELGDNSEELLLLDIDSKTHN